MFGLLKNKLTSFIKGIVGREEKKEIPAQAPEEKRPEEEKIGTHPEKIRAEPVKEEPREESRVQEKKEEPAKEQPKTVQVHKHEEKIAEEKPVHIHPHEEKKKQEPASIQVPKHEEKKQEPFPHHGEKKHEAPHPEPAAHAHAGQKTPGPHRAPPAQMRQPQMAEPESAQPSEQMDLFRLERKAASEKRDFAPKIGLVGAIKSFFSSEVTIGESEVSDLLEGLELSLLEADVAYDVSIEVTQQLRAKLVGMKVPKGEVEKKTKEAVQQVLESIMDSDRKFDLLARVKGAQKPVKILFVGPNGAGKTTTMAKLAHLFMANKLTVVFSASDTFRAAAVEQTEVHAQRLGAKVVKSKYGADPASVAFDAVNFARSHSIDVVLIDSAGRQDTNANLLSELKKINRVAAPDIKIYIGESIGGNAGIEQIRAFNEAIGMDGAILTKIDCDAKGGTAISIAKATGIPVLYLGMGQRYEDLMPFDPKKIAHEIMS